MRGDPTLWDFPMMLHEIEAAVTFSVALRFSDICGSYQLLIVDIVGVSSFIFYFQINCVSTIY